MPNFRDGLTAAAHAGLLLVIVLSGCCCSHPPPPPTGCWGPTLPMPELVLKINENNQALPTLWARHEIQADLYDKSRNKSFYVNSSGEILVRKPRELLLRG